VHCESQIALADIRALADPGKRVVFVSGNFNIVHPGHLRLLKFAAECGDVLAVGVNNRPTAASMVSPELRLESVRAIGVVSYAFMLFDPPEELVAELRPAVVVKGKEHESEVNPEKPVLDSYGGHLVFSSGEVAFSSLDLLRSEFNEYNLTTINKPLDFASRHGFAVRDLKALLAKFAGLRVLVIGDLIVDEYIACDALGMSQEDPSIVVTPVLEERFIGGAGIVAGHAAGLGAEVTLVSVTGTDKVAGFAEDKLTSYGVSPILLADDSRPTTLKTRYRVGNKTLLRVSQLKQHEIDVNLQKLILEAVTSAIDKADLVVFSDFNYGCLAQPLVDAIAALCQGRRIPMVADSQSSSQIGDVSRFRDVLLLKPTEREARLALRDFNSGLVVIAEAIRERTRARSVILTLGPEGLLVHANNELIGSMMTDRLPAFNQAPKDTAGAGDSLLVCASLALLTGADVWRSAYLGSLAAACQVGRIGNVPLTAADIVAEIDI
jgi:rfaE bifunctional protein kinase chain/domain